MSSVTADPAARAAVARQVAASGDPAQPATLQSSWHTALLGRLEQMGWLENAGKAVQGALDPLLSRPAAPRVLDLLHGRWLGHALHPALSDLPIGLWTGTVLLDAVGDDGGAAVLGATGSVAAVAAAATGVADWTVTDGRERRLALLHGIVNSAALALQMASLAARVTGRRGRARALAAGSLMVGTAAAYAGGELVFGRGLMVDHTAWTAGPAEWRPVCTLSDVDDGGIRGVEVDGRRVLLARHGATVTAFEDACSHAGGPLSEGEVHDGTVTCPWHGSCFRLTDGAVVNGPATYPQPRLLARVVDGRVEVRGREG